MTAPPPVASSGSGYVGHDELVALEAATNYNQHIANRFAEVLARIARPAAPAPAVLDFGAGIGTISRLFKQTTGVPPLAVEIDPHQRQVLTERGLRVSPGLYAVTDESIDLVFSSNVLEHIDDDVSALREIRQKLRPGGHLAVWVPAFPGLWTSLDDRVGHYRRYTRASLQQALVDAGFSSCTVCYYQDSVGFLLAAGFRVFGNKQGHISPASIRIFDRWLFPVSKAMDHVCQRWFGKNLYAVAVR